MYVSVSFPQGVISTEYRNSVVVHAIRELMGCSIKQSQKCIATNKVLTGWCSVGHEKREHQARYVKLIRSVCGQVVFDGKNPWDGKIDYLKEMLAISILENNNHTTQILSKLVDEYEMFNNDNNMKLEEFL
jgi:hypothetical protein